MRQRKLPVGSYKYMEREQKCMIVLWKTIVWPKSKHCCHLWLSDKIQAITSIEAPQRTFTSRIQGVGLLRTTLKLLGVDEALTTLVTAEDGKNIFLCLENTISK